MSRPIAPDPLDDAADELDPALANDATRPTVDLATLPIVGLTRRRMAMIAAAFLAAWIVVAFARQVADASAAATRLEAIGRQRFVEQQARAHGVGDVDEIPFTLAPDSPPLADDAPGSASVRLGAQAEDVAPLERWLTVLFGPSS